MKPAIFASRITDAAGNTLERVVSDANPLCSVQAEVRVNGKDCEYRCCETARWLLLPERTSGWCDFHSSQVIHLGGLLAAA